MLKKIWSVVTAISICRFIGLPQSQRKPMYIFSINRRDWGCWHRPGAGPPGRVKTVSHVSLTETGSQANKKLIIACSELSLKPKHTGLWC